MICGRFLMVGLTDWRGKAPERRCRVALVVGLTVLVLVIAISAT